MTPPAAARGACFRGAVSVTVPAPLRRPGNCHCGECGRLNGAAFTTWLTALLPRTSDAAAAARLWDMSVALTGVDPGLASSN